MRTCAGKGVLQQIERNGWPALTGSATLSHQIKIDLYINCDIMEKDFLFQNYLPKGVKMEMITLQEVIVLRNAFFVLAGLLVLFSIAILILIYLLKDKQSIIDQFNDDLQKQIDLTEKFKVLASIDSLTKLINRRTFEKVANRSIGLLYNGSGDQRHLNLSGIGFLFMDIDHFKDINDTYGHQTGDEILIKVSKVIKATLRETDIVCRWGGEEIAALLPVIEEKHLANTAEKVRSAVEELLEPVRVTISIGCVYTAKQCTLQALVDKADKALYQAKNNGRNQVMVAE